MKAIIAAAIVFCLGLIGLTYYFATQENSGPRQVVLDPAYIQRQKEGGWTRGSSQPKVEIIEYGDIQCPACGAANPVIRQAIENTKDIARLTFRNYPLVTIHDKALQAAIAVESAGRQGKFWEMQELLYTTQQTWSVQTPGAFATTLLQYAQALNLNIDQFKRDIKDSSVEDEITKDIKLGDALPVKHTPTVLINGKEVENLPTTTAELEALIRSEAK